MLPADILFYVTCKKSRDKFEPDAKEIVRVRLDSYQKDMLEFKLVASYHAFTDNEKEVSRSKKCFQID